MTLKELYNKLNINFNLCSIDNCDKELYIHSHYFCISHLDEFDKTAPKAFDMGRLNYLYKFIKDKNNENISSV